jgi:predicted ABC-type ATPase
MAHPRLRIFAGPNGSGKSTIIKAVREYRTPAGRPIDFGKYINADELVVELTTHGLVKFKAYGASTNKVDFEAFTIDSGLIGNRFTWDNFTDCHTLSRGILKLNPGVSRSHVEALAQILAAFFVEELFNSGKGFSFETVFSHESKLALMKRARDMGFKVYLYFVATESPLINEERVAIRVKAGGHSVPAEKISERYYRSLGLLYDAVQCCYHAYMFDNSGTKSKMFGVFSSSEKPRWSIDDLEDVPGWFYTHYGAVHKQRTAGRQE